MIDYYWSKLDASCALGRSKRLLLVFHDVDSRKYYSGKTQNKNEEHDKEVIKNIPKLTGFFKTLSGDEATIIPLTFSEC